MDVSTFVLHGMSIDPKSGLSRSAPPRVGITSERFWEGYDSTTLFYAAIHDVATEQLTLFGPPLYNLREFVDRLQFSTEVGALQRPRVIKNRRFDRIVFRCKGVPMTLRVEDGGFSASMDISRRAPDMFQGCNLVYTLSKNNDLRWVRDWLVWNRVRHGADGVLIADNASTAYSIDDLAEVIASVEGYRSAAVVSVPFSYGPDNSTATKASYAEFLQIAVMNALWSGWMSSARVVLNADIDELVTSDDGTSIFDSAARSVMGIVMCNGHWRYASPSLIANGVNHADHVLKRLDDTVCPPKYCLRPNSIAGRRVLKVHGVDGFKRMPFVSRDKFTFYHCRNISTSWKYDRGGIDPATLTTDQATATDLATVFTGRSV